MASPCQEEWVVPLLAERSRIQAVIESVQLQPPSLAELPEEVQGN